MYRNISLNETEGKSIYLLLSKIINSEKFKPSEIGEAEYLRNKLRDFILGISI